VARHCQHVLDLPSPRYFFGPQTQDTSESECTSSTHPASLGKWS
jgi:hypothetical protein